MKSRLALSALVVIVLAAVASFSRAENPAPAPVTLTGTLACAQCQLHEKASHPHQDVLTVKDGDKEVLYYVTNLPKHPNVCHSRIENAKVTGTVSEKDGVHWLAATKLELPSQ